MKKWLIIFCAAAWPLLAAEPNISVELSSDHAFLGDPVTFTITVRHERSWKVKPHELPIEFGDSRVISQEWQLPDPKDTQSPDQTSVFKAQLAWYRLGEFTVPAVEILAEGAEEVWKTPELKIQIVSMLEEGDQNLAPMKDQLALKIAPLWVWILLAGLVLAGLAILVYLWWLRRRSDAPKFTRPQLPPDREALARLDELTSGTLLKEGKFKPFYVEINQIIRHYYARLFEINAEEMTSFELEDWMASQRGLPLGTAELNDQFQRLCDNVKFAKYDPVEAENQQAVNWAYQIVDLLRPKPKEDDSVATG